MRTPQCHQLNACFTGVARSTGPSWPPCLQPNSLLLTALGFVVPMRTLIPLHLALLVFHIRSSALRCRLECGTALPSSLLSPGSAANAGGLHAPANASEAESYYSTALGWIRQVVPISSSLAGRQESLLPAGWHPGRGGCLEKCFAVHGWLQVGVERRLLLCLFGFSVCLPIIRGLHGTTPQARLPAGGSRQHVLLCCSVEPVSELPMHPA